MFRKFTMLAAGLLLCLPLGGTLPLHAQTSHVPKVLAVNADAQCLFSARDLGILAACLFVLALAATLGRTDAFHCRPPARRNDE